MLYGIHCVLDWYVRKSKGLLGDSFATYGFLVVAVPAFMLIGFFNGLLDGEDLVNRTDKAPTARVVLSEGSAPLQGQIMLLLEKYVVFLKHGEKTISTVPVSLVRLIEELPEPKGEAKR